MICFDFFGFVSASLLIGIIRRVEILTVAIVLRKEIFSYFFLNSAEIPIITPETIIPSTPIVSFDWNRYAEPRKTAADKMLPESIV